MGGSERTQEDFSLECIPDEVLLRILSNIEEASDIARCGIVNKRWRRLSFCVDRLRFVVNNSHDRSCGIVFEDTWRCTQLGESMSAWLKRMKDEGTPAREVHCFLNCLLYYKVIDWLQPALDTLQILEIAHDMDWYHDICECPGMSWFPGIWKGLFHCRNLQVLHMTCHYHAVSKSTLEDLVMHLPHLRIMDVAVHIRPPDLKLTSSSLEDFYIRCTPGFVDEDKVLTLHLDMPKLKCLKFYLKLQDTCLNLHNTPALQKMHLICGGLYYRVELTESQSGQLDSLKFLCLEGDWHSIEQIKGLLSVTSSLEELQAKWYGKCDSSSVEQIAKILPKLKKVTFNDSPTLELNSAPD